MLLIGDGKAKLNFTPAREQELEQFLSSFLAQESNKLTHIKLIAQQGFSFTALKASRKQKLPVSVYFIGHNPFNSLQIQWLVGCEIVELQANGNYFLQQENLAKKLARTNPCYGFFSTQAPQFCKNLYNEFLNIRMLTAV